MSENQESTTSIIQSILSGSATVLIIRIATFFLNIGIVIILSRTLGPVGFGIYVLLAIITGLISSFGTPPMSIANVYLTGVDKYDIGIIAGNSIIIAGVNAIGIVLLTLIIAQFAITETYLASKGVELSYLYLAIFALPFYIIYRWINSVIRGCGKITKFSLVSVSGVVVQFIALLIFYQFGEINIGSALISYLINGLASAAFALIIVGRLSPIKFSYNKLLVSESFNYSIKAYLWNALNYLNQRIIPLILGLHIGIFELGLFAAASNIVEKLSFIVEAVVTAQFPQVAKVDRGPSSEITSSLSRYVLLLLLPICALIALAAPLIVQVMFGDDYSMSIPVVRWLLPGVLAYSISRLISIDFAGNGEPQFGASLSGLSIVIAIPLVFFLTGSAGLIGAAIGTTISQIIVAVSASLYFSVRNEMRMRSIFLPNYRDLQDILLVAQTGIISTFEMIEKKSPSIRKD